MKSGWISIYCAAALVPAQLVFGQTAKPAVVKAPHAKFVAPKTSWGDPDLQGTWTADDSYGVPFERPAQYGNRKELTDEELAARAKDVDQLQTDGKEGIRNTTTGFWSRLKGVDQAANPPSWLEFARRATKQTSLVVEPENGRIPELTEDAKARRAAMNVLRNRRPDSWLDRSNYDRCITRGVAGSIFPVIYGNGTQIVQAPGVVAIRYEMIHETRIVPLDGRPHAPKNELTYMGDARGHWEGSTLVVETTNFYPGSNGVGGNGNGAPYSEDLKLVERFTRVDQNVVQYEMTVSDPKTYTAPWKVAFPITHEDGYQIFEYACHEGNYGLHNILSAARAEDKADEAAAKK